MDYLFAIKFSLLFNKFQIFINFKKIILKFFVLS
jgi:hypothetical protein